MPFMYILYRAYVIGVKIKLKQIYTLCTYILISIYHIYILYDPCSADLVEVQGNSVTQAYHHIQIYQVEPAQKDTEYHLRVNDFLSRIN